MDELSQKLKNQSLISKIFRNRKKVYLFSALLLVLNFLILFWIVQKIQVSSKAPAFLRAYKVEGQAFYQRSDSDSWYILSGEEPIESGTQIQTYENSRLILLFLNNKNRIEVSENTQISVSETSREVILDFKKGEAFMNSLSNFSDKKILIKVGARFFELENAEIFVRGSSSQDVEIHIDDGKILMHQEDVTSTFIKGQVIKFKTSKDYSVQDLDLQFSTPFNFDRYFVETSDSMEVRFAWTSSKKYSYAQLYIGDKPDNLYPYHKNPISLKRQEMQARLTKGIYYWKIRFFKNAKGPVEVESNLKKFFIEPLIRVQPISPRINAEIPLGEDGTSIQFQWNNPSDLENVFLEVSRDSDFSSLIIHEKLLGKNYYISEKLPAGTYFWRVNGFPFRSSNMISGISRKFEIIENLDTKFITPIFPNQNLRITQNMLLNGDIVFEWSSDIGEKKYRVVLEKIDGVKDLNRYEFLVDGLQIKMSPLDIGKYQWYVESEEGFKSKTMEFHVVGSRPLNLKIASKGSSLIWSQGPKATQNYRLDVMRMEAGGSISTFLNNKKGAKQSFFSKKEQYRLGKLSSGVYVFKVYALDARGSILADSDLRFLKVD